MIRMRAMGCNPTQAEISLEGAIRILQSSVGDRETVRSDSLGLADGVHSPASIRLSLWGMFSLLKPFMLVRPPAAVPVRAAHSVHTPGNLSGGRTAWYGV